MDAHQPKGLARIRILLVIIHRSRVGPQSRVAQGIILLAQPPLPALEVEPITIHEPVHRHHQPVAAGTMAALHMIETIPVHETEVPMLADMHLGQLLMKGHLGLRRPLDYLQHTMAGVITPVPAATPEMIGDITIYLPRPHAVAEIDKRSTKLSVKDDFLE